MNDFNSIIWDFDGVILNSNEIRSRGFEIILKDFPKSQVEELLNYHEQYGGLSRYHKLNYFFKIIRKENPIEEKILEYAFLFKKIMLDHLCNPDLLIKECIDFIKKNHSKYTFHIASGSDQKELIQICKALQIDHYFKSINGSPTPKTALVKSILESSKIEKIRYVLIGDSQNDHDAARDNQIRFIAYNNTALEKKYSFISSFTPFIINNAKSDK